MKDIPQKLFAVFLAYYSCVKVWHICFRLYVKCRIYEKVFRCNFVICRRFGYIFIYISFILTHNGIKRFRLILFYKQIQVNTFARILSRWFK